MESVGELQWTDLLHGEFLLSWGDVKSICEDQPSTAEMAHEEQSETI